MENPILAALQSMCGGRNEENIPKSERLTLPEKIDEIIKRGEQKSQKAREAIEYNNKKADTLRALKADLEAGKVPESVIPVLEEILGV